MQPNNEQLAMMRILGYTYKRMDNVTNHSYYMHPIHLTLSWDKIRKKFKIYSMNNTQSLKDVNKLAKALNNLCNQTTNN